MNLQKLKNLLKDPKTNWKYIIVVAILAFIAGAIIMNCLSKQEFEIPNIVLPERKDETKDWKTYRNEKYGFGVKLPGDWVIDDSKKERVTFNSPENEKLYEKIKAGEIYGEGYTRDITISYYDTVAEEQENKYNKLEAASELTTIDAQILSTFRFIE